MGCCGEKTPSSFNSHLVGCQCSSCTGCTDYLSNPNCPTIVNPAYNATVEISSTWVVPQCQQTTVVIASPGLVLPVGALLWSPDYGYFEIMERDQLTGRTTILNTCTFPIVSPGATVPGCTRFILAANAILPGSVTGIFLTSDFTAPLEGECVTVQFTTTEGLSAGLTIGVGSGIYLLNAIFADGVSAVICNQGGGFPPGTPITAIGTFGNFLYPITITGYVLANKVSAIREDFRMGNYVPATIPPLPNVGLTFALDTPTAVISNPFGNRTLVIFGIATVSITGFMITTADEPINVIAQLSVVGTVNPLFSFLHEEIQTWHQPANDPGVTQGIQVRQSFRMSVPPGGTETFRGRLSLIMSAGVAITWRYLITEQDIGVPNPASVARASVTYMGVPI